MFVAIFFFWGGGGGRWTWERQKNFLEVSQNQIHAPLLKRDNLEYSTVLKWLSISYLHCRSSCWFSCDFLMSNYQLSKLSWKILGQCENTAKPDQERHHSSTTIIHSKWSSNFFYHIDNRNFLSIILDYFFSSYSYTKYSLSILVVGSQNIGPIIWIKKTSSL